MIKKMWAVFDVATKECISVCHYKPKLIKKDDREYFRYINNDYDKHFVFLKPVWVSDRDPHENVRKCFKKFPQLAKDFALQCPELERCLKKDIKNFDSEEAG